MRYILNSAVITTPGTYQYRLLTVEEATTWLSQGEYESSLGYQETCTALEAVTGVSVSLNRRQIKMEAGDEALVFRLTARLDPTTKGRLTPEIVREHSEIGLLRREQ